MDEIVEMALRDSLKNCQDRIQVWISANKKLFDENTRLHQELAEARAENERLKQKIEEQENQLDGAWERLMGEDI